MTGNEIEAIVAKQQAFFASGATLPVEFRLAQLRRLRDAITSHEDDINAALASDLGKSSYESYMCETGLSLAELSYMIKHTRAFARRKTVHTPVTQFAARSFTQAHPYGATLIMSPWNYPLLLTISPLANAISAGNTALLKPSAYSPATSAVVAEIMAECFSPEYVAVVTGGRAENTALLDQKFDFIFFTGSQTVGKEVLRHAAAHLTPVVLELGGKSPCIVDATANVPLAAKRIVFGKFLNCGQTCVAPDYLLVERRVRGHLIDQLRFQIKQQFGDDPLENVNYGKIINRKHFDRLVGLIDQSKVVCGGRTQACTCQIEPTIMDHVTEEDAVMGEEIFGPILPILTFDSLDQVIVNLKSKAKPLAVYAFTQNKRSANRIMNELSFGGGCINDVVIHLATSEMGFGGVGESGMGSYHGVRGFEAFSHSKSIVDKKTWIDLPLRYQPYPGKLSGDLRDKLLHMFLH